MTAAVVPASSECLPFTDRQKLVQLARSLIPLASGSGPWLDTHTDTTNIYYHPHSSCLSLKKK